MSSYSYVFRSTLYECRLRIIMRNTKLVLSNRELCELRTLIDDLYWEYDRMSGDGKHTLDKMAELTGLPTRQKE